jgi:hypothetical protein
MLKVRGNWTSCRSGAVKIYVTAVEVLMKKERQDETQDETQFTTKINK